MSAPNPEDLAPRGAELPTHSDLLATLKEAIDDVFQLMVSGIEARLSDSEPQPAAEEDADSSTGFIEAVVGFQGSLNGHVCLRCSHGGAEEIAKGLLMMEKTDAIAADELQDALGEYANMVAGALKTRALDPVEGGFQLGIPEVRRPASDAATDDQLVYQLENGAFTAEIWLAPAAA